MVLGRHRRRHHHRRHEGERMTGFRPNKKVIAIGWDNVTSEGVVDHAA